MVNLFQLLEFASPWKNKKQTIIIITKIARLALQPVLSLNYTRELCYIIINEHRRHNVYNDTCACVTYFNIHRLFRPILRFFFCVILLQFLFMTN